MGECLCFVMYQAQAIFALRDSSDVLTIGASLAEITDTVRKYSCHMRNRCNNYSVARTSTSLLYFVGLLKYTNICAAFFPQNFSTPLSHFILLYL